MAFRSLTFNQADEILAQDDGMLYNHLQNEEAGVFPNIKNECIVQQAGFNLTVQSGYVYINGRIISVDTDEVVSVVPPVSAEFGYLIVEVDLSLSVGNQVSIKEIKQPSSFPTLQQDDLNNNLTGKYQYPLVSFEVNAVGFVLVTDTRNLLKLYEDREAELKARMDALPNDRVLSSTYDDINNRILVDLTTQIPDWEFSDKKKLTIQFPEITDENDRALPAFLRITDSTGTNTYTLRVRSTSSNQPQNQYVESQVKSIYRDGVNVIVNVTDPVLSPETEYDELIQSQQTTVPVEGAPFGLEKIEGKSRANMFGVEGNFEVAGLGGVGEGWASSPSNTTMTLDNDSLFGDKAQRGVTDGTLGSRRITNKQELIEGRTYAFSGYSKGNIVNTTCRFALIKSGAPTKAVTFTPSGEYDRYGVVATIEAGQSGEWDCSIYIADGAAINDVLFDGMIIEDITIEFDSGDITTIDDYFSRVGTYYENLKSVENPEIKTISKNVWKPLRKLEDRTLEPYVQPAPNNPVSESNIDAFVFDGNGKIITPATPATSRLNFTIGGLKPNSQYTISFKTSVFSGSIYRIFGLANQTYLASGYTSTLDTDENGNIKWADSGDDRFAIFTLASTAASIEIFDIQLEEGSSATIFEDYDKSSIKHLAILRSVDDGAGNEVKDEIDPVNNRVIRRVLYDTETIKDESSWSSINELTNTIEFASSTVPLFPDVEFSPNNSTLWFFDLVLDGTRFPYKTISEITANDEEGCILTDNGQVAIRILKSKLGGTTSTDFVNYLSGIDVESQLKLAEPEIEENIDFDGILRCFADMTIEINQDNGFSYSIFAKHPLNPEATIPRLAKLLEETQKEVTKLEQMGRSIKGWTGSIACTGAGGNVITFSEEVKIGDIVAVLWDQSSTVDPESIGRGKILTIAFVGPDTPGGNGKDIWTQAFIGTDLFFNEFSYESRIDNQNINFFAIYNNQLDMSTTPVTNNQTDDTIYIFDAFLIRRDAEKR